MRKILFRGKGSKTGVWHEGYYIHLHKTTYALKTDEDIDQNNEIHQIVFERMTDWGLPNDYLRVDVMSKTVGEYTGLTDTNGKKIFEGDIVFVSIKGNKTVCKVAWADSVAQFQLWQKNTIPHTPTNLNLGNYDCEVIGNIYDNPELLNKT